MQTRGSALINVMVNAAQKAGRGLRRAFSEIEKLQVSRKGPSEYVTEADHRAERTIFEELQHARPKFGFNMEKSGIIDGSDNSNRWIIAPLDGTLNFIHGLPHFAVSIGLERDREIFAGVVYEPITDQLFWAEKGKGAFLNENRIRVSTRRKMNESLFATGIPFAGREGHGAFLTELENVMAVSAGVRRFGAPSLDLAYVATGRYDGFWENGLRPWEMAAGMIIVREAGGYVTDYDGKNNMLSSGSIIVSNDHLHTPLKKLINAPGK